MRIATLRYPLAADRAMDLLARLDRFYGEQPYMLWNHWPSPDLGAYDLHFATHLRLRVRLPGAVPGLQPPELRIVDAAEATVVADWERVVIDGYPLPDLQPARLGVLADERTVEGSLRICAGYVGDHPVTTVAALPDGAVNGIYTLAAVPEARGRGYGSAITVRALAGSPTLPAVLQATEEGARIYARHGFMDVSQVGVWLRPARGW